MTSFPKEYRNHTYQVIGDILYEDEKPTNYRITEVESFLFLNGEWHADLEKE